MLSAQKIKKLNLDVKGVEQPYASSRDESYDSYDSYDSKDDFISLPQIDLNYIQLLDVANNKEAGLLAQEKEVAELLLKALENDSGVNSRLSKLTNEQIRVLFPCIYVEANHKLNPIKAYNTKDRGVGDKNVDDNVAMLRGYSTFLSAVTEVTEDKKKGKSLEERADSLLNSFHKLVGTLANVGLENVFGDHGAYYSVNEKDIYNLEGMKKNLKGGALAKKLKTLSCGHEVGVVTLYPNIMFCDIRESADQKNNIMHEIFMKYLSCLDDGDVLGIFQVTADFQFLHLLQNANGRSSQIMRDCALMHLGYLPLSSLTNISHYLSPQQPVELEHFTFMQNISEELLSGVEGKNLTLSLCKRNTHELRADLSNKAKTDVIKFDVNLFLKS
ncbi:hypothetical protein [Enterobacter roggenkampii]|uniref:hypothetical protein n=1 Tax=Enterobacter roggenkampii TaxID=1812935 RepID=UPI00084C80D3|nr:hypothetical protein [Enterobacter roggenkampii]AOP98033.1 hypothetical protein BFV67_22945 [Enterobacter roggenkampii]QWZ75366.1 hypothetical protein I6L60_23010 [Enterobacter roggenkampii]